MPSKKDLSERDILFKVCDELEVQINSQTLTQVVLKEAFEGEKNE